MQSTVKSMSPYEWLLLVVLSILWGGSFFFVGVAVEALPPLTIVTLRVSLAAIALWGVVCFCGLRVPSNPTVWLAFIGMGILNNVIPFVLIVWGQTHIASGLASILNATTPLFTVVAAHFLTSDEKMSTLKILGVIFGLIGVVIMIGQEAFGGQGGSILGQIAVLGAAISYSFAGIYGRRFKRLGLQPVVTATGQVTASSLLLIPVALFYDHPFTLPVPDVEVWLAILCLALFSTALAYILYFRILSAAGATNVLLVTLLVPVSAIVLGTAILGEQLELKHMVGMGMISLGLLTIDGRLLQLIGDRFRIQPVCQKKNG
ncbi:DMT family transporter [Desulfogranum marinum]|uniref:DMT family transporter n=1 Tax=Desulfogranum marinum TaxID=453220 RepID=UPI001964555E|nr:DMT family transporter [Desulfogranum marinum]MBM9511823.1 DMT family transporter [Desulfogranum marinum]